MKALYLLFLPLFSTLVFGACNPKEVDETGYLRPPEIDITSEEELSNTEESKILVVGSPGAVEVTGGKLTLTSSSGDSATLLVDDSSGSFVATLMARRDDQIELVYEQDGEDSVVLSLRDAAVIEAPDCFGCLAGPFSAPDAEGNTVFDIAVLSNPSPPYTLFNQNLAVAVRTTTIGLIRIAARSGDRVCVFQDAANETSRALCDLVP